MLIVPGGAGGGGGGGSLKKRSMMLFFSLRDVLTENIRYAPGTTPFLAVGKVSFRIHSIKARATGYHYIIKIEIMIVIMILYLALLCYLETLLINKQLLQIEHQLLEFQLIGG